METSIEYSVANESMPVVQGEEQAIEVLVREAEAEANLLGLKAQADALRQQVRLEITQARLAIESEKAAVRAAGEFVRNAREQLVLAEGRYEVGVGSIIELDAAQLSLTSAKAQEAQEDFKLATARSQLLKAIGREP
ncbi:MAG TPA: TolC family protein [Chroococcales cyanobacterium]